MVKMFSICFSRSRRALFSFFWGCGIAGKWGSTCTVSGQCAFRLQNMYSAKIQRFLRVLEPLAAMFYSG